MSLGAGAYATAIVGAVTVMLVLLGLRLTNGWTGRLAGQRVTFEVDYVRGHGTLGPLLRAVQAGTGRLADSRIEDDDDPAGGGAGVRRVVIRMQVWEPGSIDQLLDCLRGRQEILAIRVLRAWTELAERRAEATKRVHRSVAVACVREGQHRESAIADQQADNGDGPAS